MSCVSRSRPRTSCSLIPAAEFADSILSSRDSVSYDSLSPRMITGERRWARRSNSQDWITRQRRFVGRRAAALMRMLHDVCWPWRLCSRASRGRRLHACAGWIGRRYVIGCIVITKLVWRGCTTKLVAVAPSPGFRPNKPTPSLAGCAKARTGRSMAWCVGAGSIWLG